MFRSSSVCSPRDVRAKRFFRKNSPSYRVSSRCVSVFNLRVFSLRILDSSFLRAFALVVYVCDHLASILPFFHRVRVIRAANQAKSRIYICPSCRALSGYVERSKFLRVLRICFGYYSDQSHSTSLI